MTDRELVNRVLNDRHQQSFAEIVSRYSGMVFSKALSVVHREELAKEVAQQTFIRAYERLAYWRKDSLGPWLDDPDREALLQRMEQAIGQLPEQDQTIIRLHYYQQQKTDEIAQQTGLSQSNVLVRLHRIRDRLRRSLGAE